MIPHFSTKRFFYHIYLITALASTVNLVDVPTICDDKTDCTYKKNDTSELEVESCDSRVMFYCGNGRCIFHDQVCDRNNDCGDWKDEPEDKCRRSECAINNGYCSQLCVYTPMSYRCECFPGYKLNVDNLTCDDIDECQSEDTCPQLCVNKRGSFKCECWPGRNLTHDGSCEETGESFLLANRHDIREINLDSRKTKILVDHQNLIYRIDYTTVQGLIVWSDLETRKIMSLNVTSRQTNSIISQNIRIPLGIAVDWIYEHVYWTDMSKNTIEVCTLDGKLRKTLVNTDLDRVPYITVDPIEGLMFWENWNGPAIIERAGLDGSVRSLFTVKTNQSPGGLALDFIDKRIFWIDLGQNALLSADYDGQNRHVIVSDPKVITFPNSLDVFQNHVYLVDIAKRAVLKINKFNGQDMTTEVRVFLRPRDIRVYHSAKKPSNTNHCIVETDKCSHFCFPTPRFFDQAKNYTCACPDNLVLSEDGFSCL